MSAFVGLVMCLATATVHGQAASAEPEKRVYLFGGYGVAWESGPADWGATGQLRSPGGRENQWWVGAGGFVTSWLGLEGTFQRTGRFDAIELTQYQGHGQYRIERAERRDTLFSVAARFRLYPRSVIAAEPVVGFDVIREASWKATTFGLNDPTRVIPDPSPYVDSWGFGFSGGADVRIGSGRVAALPGLRARRFVRGAGSTLTWPGGGSNWSIEMGVAMRVAF